MSTSVTASDVRTRWPVVTTTVASDAQLAVFITEADDLAVNNIRSRETAITHLAAHLALCGYAAASVSGATGGPKQLASAAFVDRSVSYATPATVSVGITAADFMRTEPGRQYLMLARGAGRLNVAFPPL